MPTVWAVQCGESLGVGSVGVVMGFQQFRQPGVSKHRLESRDAEMMVVREHFEQHAVHG
jgi:hypothetical protein